MTIFGQNFCNDNGQNKEEGHFVIKLIAYYILPSITAAMNYETRK